MTPLIYPRAGDGCVEIVIVTEHGVNIIRLDAARAIQFGHRTMGEGLDLQRTERTNATW